MRGESRKETKEPKVTSSFLVWAKTYLDSVIPCDTDIRNPGRCRMKLKKKRLFHCRKYAFVVCKDTLIKLPNVRVRWSNLLCLAKRREVTALPRSPPQGVSMKMQGSSSHVWPCTQQARSWTFWLWNCKHNLQEELGSPSQEIHETIMHKNCVLWSLMELRKVFIVFPLLLLWINLCEILSRLCR